MWITTTRCACTAPSASSLRPICWPGGRRRSAPRAIASWRRRAGSGSYVGNRRREMVTMTVPGETEAGNAGMHPCRGIAWWAHRDDDQSAEALPRSSKNQIGSVDPDALKIPARRAEFTLTENARVPFHAEPGQFQYYRRSCWNATEAASRTTYTRFRGGRRADGRTLCRPGRG